MGINRRKSKRPRLQKRFVQISRDQEHRLFEVAKQHGEGGAMGQGLRRRGNAKVGNQFLFSCLQYRGEVISRKRATEMSNAESTYVVALSTFEGMDQTCLLCEPVLDPAAFMKEKKTPKIVAVASTQKGPGLVPMPTKIHYETVYLDGRPSVNPLASRINGTRWDIEDQILSDIGDFKRPQRPLQALHDIAQQSSSNGNCELVAALAKDRTSAYRIVGCFVYVRGNLTDEFMSSGTDPRVDSHHFRTPAPGAWLSMNYMSTGVGLRAGLVNLDRRAIATDAQSLYRYEQSIQEAIEPVFRIQLPQNLIAVPAEKAKSVRSPYDLAGANFVLILSKSPITSTSAEIESLAVTLSESQSLAPFAIVLLAVHRKDVAKVKSILECNGHDVLSGPHSTRPKDYVLARRKWLYKENDRSKKS